MKGGHVIWQQSGFTIVETMIVLGVTGIIIFAAMLAMQGKTSNAEFTQAINSVQADIRASINDINNGYYPSFHNIDCSAKSPGTPTISDGTNGEGQNIYCALYGSVLQFAPNGSNTFNTYTVTGREYLNGCSLPQKGGGQLCPNPTTYTQNIDSNIYDAFNTDIDPLAIIPGTNNNFENPNHQQYTTTYIESSLEIHSMYYSYKGGVHNTDNVAFLSNPSTLGISPTNGNATGSEVLGLFVVNDKKNILYISPTHTNTPKDLGNTIFSINTQIISPSSNTPSSFIPITGSDTVNICFKGTAVNKSGLITIGGSNNGQLNVNLKVYYNSTCS